MDRNAVIMVTGAAGFIGSCLTGYLNRKGYHNIIIVDDFTDEEKTNNFIDRKIYARVERDVLFTWLDTNPIQIDFVFHLGARTDTTEFDYSIHEKLNVEYSKNIWQYCTEKKIPLVYASSAATYGSGEFGYSDSHELVEKLHPLNPYGVSKNEFDKWAIKKSRESGVESRKTASPFWAGLKFFNVYGPNEYHKGRMASVVFHSFNQVQTTGKVKLFRSHNPNYKDGEQLRDFIYADDVVSVCYWFMQKSIEPDEVPASGLYNLGTGKARTFNDLVKAIFVALDKPVNIEYFDIPIDIRDKYQYFTEADMTKLREAGYKDDFYSLEKGIETYLKNFLLEHKYY
jgi:ADP-L-glycero-D-manno-heptose 6-epimerase